MIFFIAVKEATFTYGNQQKKSKEKAAKHWSFRTSKTNKWRNDVQASGSVRTAAAPAN
jgi:hypothetical protein